MLEMFKVDAYFDTTKTMANPLFGSVEYPWEILPMLDNFIRQLGPMLSPDEFEQRGEDVWISKSAKVAESASITGPCIIDANAQIRHCAFIRGSVIVGKGAVVGNSCEIKNSLLFDEVEGGLLVLLLSFLSNIPVLPGLSVNLVTLEKPSNFD